jgi:hypothetical protein
MIARVTRRNRRQVILSTHSEWLVGASDVDPSEILLLQATDEDTKVLLASDDAELRAIAEADSSLAPILVARTRPARIEQLALFGG